MQTTDETKTTCTPCNCASDRAPDTLRTVTQPQSQADAILSIVEDHLASDDTITIGRTRTGWFARCGDSTGAHFGVTAKDALAQLAQVLVCE